MKMSKAKKMKSVRKCKVGKTMRGGEQKASRGCKGVIAGVSLNIELEESFKVI